MGNWLERQWNDIRGNFKWWLMLAIIGAVVPAFEWLTSGLEPWRKVGAGCCLGFLLVWASIATWRRRPDRIPDQRVRPQMPGYSEFTQFTVALGAYKNLDFGTGKYGDRIRVELLEITRERKPGASDEEDADYRCVRLSLDGFIPCTGRGAIEVVPNTRPFEVILFEFESSRMMTPSMAFDFRPRQEGFYFIAITVEHINVEAKTAEFGVYTTDLWTEPSSKIRVSS